VETILQTQVQISVSEASVITALALPAGTQISGAEWNSTASLLTINAQSAGVITGDPATVQTITTEIGQFILDGANALTALGLPATATIQEASWDFGSNQLSVVATNPVSTTGTP
jgi:hypothetical protein